MSASREPGELTSPSTSTEPLQYRPFPELEEILNMREVVWERVEEGNQTFENGLAPHSRIAGGYLPIRSVVVIKRGRGMGVPSIECSDP
jgi:hypothetical protein